MAAQLATRSGTGIDVEDVAALSLGFASGAVGTLHTGYMLSLSGGGYHNAVGYDTYVGVNGRTGRVTYSSNGTPTSIYVESSHPSWASAPRRTFDYTFTDSPAYGGPHGEAFLRAFIDACLGNGEPMATGEDATPRRQNRRRRLRVQPHRAPRFYLEPERIHRNIFLYHKVP